MIKLLFRVGVVGAVLAGGTLLVAGPERVGVMLAQAQQSVAHVIDSTIDDPVALRKQLHDLEGQYPEKISRVRADLAELNEHIRQLERDKAIAERVVSLADGDLRQAQSDAALTDQVPVGTAGYAQTKAYYERAVVKVNQIRQTRVAYATRAVDAERDLGYLEEQASRLEEILAQLETERAQFQAQLMQLDREIDTIARNDRLIELMQERQRTIDEVSRYQVASLDQLQGRLSELRTRQEAELQFLAEARQQMSYEEQAALQIDMESVDDAVAPVARWDVPFTDDLQPTDATVRIR